MSSSSNSTAKRRPRQKTFKLTGCQQVEIQMKAIIVMPRHRKMDTGHAGGRGAADDFPGGSRIAEDISAKNEGEDFDDERVSSARKRIFMGFCHGANAKLGGVLHENSTTWSITLGMNVKAAAITDTEVLDVLHVAFKDIPLSFYQTDILVHRDGKSTD
jgi:hypothetical protein